MAERRRRRRYRRRYPVRFGERDFTSSGFTADLSSTGMFITSARMPPLDSRIHVQVLLEDGNFLVFEGQVMRQKLIPGALRGVERGGFGVRFLAVEEVLQPLMPNADARFLLRYASKEDLARDFASQFKMGGVFLPTTKAFQRDAQVVVDVALDFAREMFEFEASVVQVVESGVRGIGVQFQGRGEKDPKAILAAFLP